MRNLLCWTAANYVRLVWRSGRWINVNDAVADDIIGNGRAAIICFWHGRLLMLPQAWRWKKTFFMLISQHPDGQLISKTVEHFGIKTISGSTGKGGTSAVREMVRVLNDGNYIGVTPDGPRGPRMRASEGLINIARLTGATLLPVAISSHRGKWFNSWDRFLLSAPFSGGAVVWGDPVNVPRDTDDSGIEAARQEVENQLNAATAEADRLCGQEPIEPAPVARDLAS